MVAINPNNYPNSALAASAPAAPATPPAPVTSPDAAPQASPEATSASGEASDTPKTAAAKPTDSTAPATPDLVISKDMAKALSSEQIQKLINGILADGTVDKLDDSQLKQLNILLTAAAQKDGKVSGEENSLMDALDSRGMFGTNREVVKANLQALRKHEGEANTLNFGDGSIQVTTQDGVSGFFGGKQTRGLRMEMVDLDSSTPPANNATPTGETTGPSETPAPPNTPSPTTENTLSPDVASPTPVTPPVDPEKALSTEARQAYHEQALAQNTANEAQLKEDLNYLKNAFSKVPDEVIAQDIKSLVEHSDNEGYDMTYVKNQLQNWKIALPENLDSESAEDMKAFLSSYEVSPENIQAYRQSINTVIDKATSESPLTGTALSDAKKFLYDTNYIFENPANVPEEDYQRYSQFKTSLLNYQDSEARAKNISRNENISTTNVELDNQLLGNYNQKAVTEIQDLAQNVNTFLKQVESKNAGDEEVQALRSQLGEVVEVDEQGQLVLNAEGRPQVKQPITQQHLESLNKIWASLEAVGMQNGLDRETGEITQDFFKELQSKTEAGNPKAIAQWNTIQKSPAGEILATKPEIAQYADLLKVLDDPKNAALKAALFSSDNPEQAVNELLAKHNSAVFNDMFGDFGSIWNVGPASYLTSWGCNVIPGAADTAFCQGITGPSTSLLDQPLPGSLPDYSLSLNDTTAKASFGLDLQTPALSLNSPLVNTDGKLALGSYTTEDVRQLLDLLKDPQALENPDNATDEEKTAAAYALAEKQQLRAQLKEHSSDIAGFINDTPELEGLRQQLDAKEAFDSAFWGDNSDMDQARQSVKTLVSKQDRVGSDLAVAEAQIQAALEQAPDEATRAGLQQKLQSVQEAQQSLAQSGQILGGDNANSQKQLQSVMDSLRNKGVASNNSTEGGIAQNLIADTQTEQMQSQIDQTMETLATINNDPAQREAIINKFPPEQRQQVSNLLDNHDLLDELRKQVLADPSMADPGTLKAFGFASYLTNLAQNGSEAEIQAAMQAPLPGSNLTVADSIDHMDRLLTHVNSLSTEDINLKATYAKGLVTYFNQEAFKQGQSVDEAWNHFNTGTTTVNGETMPVQKAVQMAIVNQLKGSSSRNLGSAEELSNATPGAAASAETEAQIKAFLESQDQSIQNIALKPSGSLSSYERMLQKYVDLESRRDSLDPNTLKSEYARLQKEIEESSRGGTLPDNMQTLLNNVGSSQSIVTGRIDRLEQTRIGDETAAFERLFDFGHRTAEIGVSQIDDFKSDPQKVAYINGLEGGRMINVNGQNMTRFEAIEHYRTTGKTPEALALLPSGLQGDDNSTVAVTELRTALGNVSRGNDTTKVVAALGNGEATAEEATNAVFANTSSSALGEVVTSLLVAEPEKGSAVTERIQNFEQSNPHATAQERIDFYRRLEQEFFSDEPIFAEFIDSQEKELGLIQADATAVETAVKNGTAAENPEFANVMATANHKIAVINVGSEDPEALRTFEQHYAETDYAEARRTADIDNAATMKEAYQRGDENGDYTLATNLSNTVGRMSSQVAQANRENFMEISKERGIPYTPPAYAGKLDYTRTGPSGGTAAEQRAAALVEEANALANRLSLTPEGANSNELLSDLISGFIDTIRDQDYKTRQLIMAQLANQMMTDSITTFYKDKTDKNNKYHQDAIERMANSMQQMIQRTLQDSLINAASDGQGIAALSGQVGAANTAEAMGLEQLRQSTEALLSETQKMEPPLMTDLQKERLLQTLFDKNPDNDMLGILTLAGAVN